MNFLHKLFEKGFSPFFFKSFSVFIKSFLGKVWKNLFFKKGVSHKGKILWVWALLLSFVWSACPAPLPPLLHGVEEEELPALLAKRRREMATVESDLKFIFPPGTFITSSLEGHGAYKFDGTKPRLRVAAVGPLGAISLDLIVRDGDYRVRLPGRTELLCEEDLCVIYGDSTLIRTPGIMARRPGLFFGGIPEEIKEDWLIKKEGESKWVVPPDGAGSRYLVEGNPPRIIKAIIKEENVGELTVNLEQWEETFTGPVPIKIVVKFDSRALFSVKLRNVVVGGDVPERVFEMAFLFPLKRTFATSSLGVR